MTVVGSVIWSAAVLAAAGAAAPVAEVVLIPVAVVAAASGVRALRSAPARRRSGRNAGRNARSSARSDAGRDARRDGRGDPRRGNQRLVAVAVAGSVAVPLAALAGALPGVAALAVLAAAVLVLGGPAPRSAAGGRPGARLEPRVARLVVAVGPALAAMSLILARQQTSSGVLALLVATLAFDAGAFMMGNARTATGGPVGVVFGLASVAVVAVAVAAVMDPPFSGARPWAVFAGVGLLAAAGVWVCDRAVAGSRSPALLRLDSLMLSAPAWVISLAVIGHG